MSTVEPQSAVGLATKRVLIVLSERAGGNGRSALEQIVAEVRQLAAEVEPLFFDRAEQPVAALDIPGRVEREGFDAVVVCGGDGTIREVLQALWLAGRKTPVGIVPTGSANVLARMLGLPLDRAAALERLREARVREMPAAVLNERCLFLIAACFGHLARVTLDADRLGKQRYGWLAYGLAGLRYLWWSPRQTARLRMNPNPSGVADVLAHSMLVLLDPGARLLVPPEQWTLSPLTICWGDNRTIFGSLSILYSWLYLRRSNRHAKVLGTERIEVAGFKHDEVYIDGDHLHGLEGPYVIQPVPEPILVLA